MMKKFLAILLAMMLVLVNVAALAGGVDPDNPDTPAVTPDEGESGDTASSVTPSPVHPVTFEKDYTIIKAGENVKVPADATLKFTAELTAITNSTLTVEDATDAVKSFEFTAPIAQTDATDTTVSFEKAITGQLPQYPVVGIYTYKLTESGNNPAGVTYSEPVYMKVIVLANGNALEIGSVTLRTEADPDNEKTGKDETKIGEITNEYAAGKLTITKKVTGNMGNKQQFFEMTVSFTSANKVYGDMTITLNGGAKVTKIDNDESTATTIPGDGWTTKTVTFELKDSDSIMFENVPATVSYSVTETKAGEDGYETKIEGSDLEAAIEKATKDSKAEGAVEVEGEETKSITADTVTVTNDKGITIDTGIELETLPFVLLMGIALVGVMALRRREDY